jgi:hypothetical protein
MSYTIKEELIMKHRHELRVPKALVSILIAGLCAVPGLAAAGSTPTYTINKVLVAEDQWQGEDGVVDPKPIYKPHESDASYFPDYWISSNERGDEEVAGSGKGGITILKNGSNAVLSQVSIESACIPVVQLNGSLGACAPAGAEGHPRHPHGIDIDTSRRLAYQVAEHSGLKWNAGRTGFEPAATTDEESGLLVVYDVRDPRNPRVLKGYVLGHAAEESAVNEVNGKVYVGNHEPSPTTVPCFVSVINPSSSHPYRFIDLPNDQSCVQGIEVDEGLNTVNGTTHIGQKMYTFNSSNDTIAYSVDIRGPFNAFVAGLPASQRFTIPDGWVLHMHDLTADKSNHRAYQTIHTIGDAATVEEEEGTVVVEEADEITGRWVAEVNTNPRSRDFKRVRIIDLSNGQSVPAVRTHGDAVDTGLPYNRLFVHAHFLAVDPSNDALIVSGEHTGNAGVVDTDTRRLKQVLAISRPIPNCVRTPEIDETTGLPLPLEAPEPHVHGVNIQALAGTAYVSDEGEDCFYESVTVLRPSN